MCLSQWPRRHCWHFHDRGPRHGLYMKISSQPYFRPSIQGAKKAILLCVPRHTVKAVIGSVEWMVHTDFLNLYFAFVAVLKAVTSTFSQLKWSQSKVFPTTHLPLGTAWKLNSFSSEFQVACMVIFLKCFKLLKFNGDSPDHVPMALNHSRRTGLKSTMYGCKLSHRYVKMFRMS